MPRRFFFFVKCKLKTVITKDLLLNIIIRFIFSKNLRNMHHKIITYYITHNIIK